MLLRATKTFAGKLGLVRKGMMIEVDNAYGKELLRVGVAREEKEMKPSRVDNPSGPPRTAEGNVLTPGSRKGGKGGRSSVSLRGRASRAKTSTPAEGAPES